MQSKPIRCLIAVVFFLLIAALQPCAAQSGAKSDTTITVTSTAFPDGGTIPGQYACTGKNISFPLAWRGVPTDAKSIALIMDDPDAPGGTYVHWVVYNMPPNRKDLPENVRPGKNIPGGGLQGVTTGRRNGYLGPCPPSGTHRYFIKIFALDTMLKLKSGASKRQLLEAMQGHVIASGRLMGKYKK